MQKIILITFFSLFCIFLQAQKVDTITVYSTKMSKGIKNVVVLPSDYTATKKYPVVYLLHGHGGNYATFVRATKKALPQVASEKQIIFVCPDGQNSWYWDSPVNPKSQFETYVSSELIKYIDSKYSTVTSPKGRAVTGFSMGGHGGLWLGLRHPNVFGACGSMSGGVDIRPFPNNWNMKDHLGNYKGNEAVWNAHTVINQLDKIKSGASAIIIDCGTDDFFLKVNESLHKKMLEKKIPHDYIIRPGGHTHSYWDNALDYQILFFSKFFNKK